MADLKELGTLIVVVGKARNLPNKSRFGKQDPFCTVVVAEEKQRTKAIKRGGQHPEWDEEMRFTIWENVDDLLVRSESQNQFDSLSSNSKHTSLSSNTNPSHPTPPPKDLGGGSLNSSLSGSVTAQALASKSRKGPIGKKGGKSMKVACFADDAKEPELIGEVTVPIDEVLKQGEVDEWYEFSFKDKYSGEVYLELTFYSNDAPPIKRNVPRPSVHPYDLMPSSSSSSLSGRPGGLAASGSVSGMNLYIPPYVQAGRISPAPGPPPGSGGFADLGLPPGHRHSLATPIPPNPMDALTRPMSGLSINTPPAQQTPPRASAPSAQGHGYGGHRHSLGGLASISIGEAPAPWSHDLPQQQPTQHPGLLRPVSAAQAQPSSSYSMDPRRGTPQPFPPSGVYDSRSTTPTPAPIPNSLVAGHGRVPISIQGQGQGYETPRPHAQSFSGPTRPVVPPQHQPSYLQPSPGPTPPPHSTSAPPNQFQQPQQQPHYQMPVSSYGGPGQPPHPGYDPRSSSPYPQAQPLNMGTGQGQGLGGLPQPPPSRSNSLPVRQPSPQPQPPSQQGYYPDRSYTPRPSYPGPDQVDPNAGSGYQHHPQQQGQGHGSRPSYSGQTYDDRYTGQPPSNGYQIPTPPEPPREPTPNSQGYIPWYQQTQNQNQNQQNSHGGYNQYATPPPIPAQRPQSVQPPAPPPPRSSVGYYPSDELYVHPQAPPQPPPRGSTPQPPAWQQQQQQQQTTSAPWQQQAPPPPAPHHAQRPVSPQPPIPGGWQQQQPPAQEPYGYQQQPQQHQAYDQQQHHQQQQQQPYDHQQRYTPSPVPSHAPPAHTPSPYQPQQQQHHQQYIPNSSPSNAGYQPHPPPGWQSTVPGPHRAPSPSPSAPYAPPPPAPARAPSPLPTQMGQDWRSYLQSLPTPGRSPSPAPPPQDQGQGQGQGNYYTPPPSLPSSLKPPDGWQSNVPTSSDGHQWKR